MVNARGSGSCLSDATRPRDVRHVLVVEDDSPMRSMLADVLNDAGYGVLQARDGAEGLRRLREAQPDLIVLDLMLPGMSGWQFLERSRAELEQAQIPVIILSAIRGEGDYPSTLGVAAWLTKPIDVDRLLAAVESLAGAPVAPAAEASILVIEDEKLVRDMVLEHLTTDGFNARGVTTIAEAHSALDSQRPALIVLDLMLPGQSGWQFLRDRQANAELAEIPVVVISAAPHERLLDAKALGADAFLSKPFDLDALSTLARSFVNDDSR